MAYAKLSLSQAASINLARQYADDATRKMVKRDIFAAAKAAYGIPADTKLKCETADTAHADYLVLKDSANSTPFTLDPNCGAWIGATSTPSVVAPQRWFKVSAADVRTTLEEFLDNADYTPDTYADSESNTENLNVAFGGIAIDPYNGDVYLKADEDRFER